MHWTRRRVALAAWASLLVLAAASGPVAGLLGGVPGVDVRVVLPSGRAYILHTPPLLRLHPTMAEGRPAMIFLHGFQDDVSGAIRSTGFNALADRDGDLVAYPEGVRRSFDAGLCCGDAVAFAVDDVGFLSQVVADLRRRGAGRIAVAGFSNGAMMAYRLGCTRPRLVDSVAAMSGTLELPRCAGPIRALALHGRRDQTVPFTGTAYSLLLRCFLRDVRTIPAAAPGSHIMIELIPGVSHRWTVPRDPVDATARFWAFARMGD